MTPPSPTSNAIEKAVRVAPWNDPEVRWVCENHPTKDHGHRLFFGFGKECGGAGMPEISDKNILKGYVSTDKTTDELSAKIGV